MAVLSEILPSRMARRGAPGLVGLAVLIALLHYGKLFFVTLLSAIIISFILEPFVQLIMKLRMPRGPASFVACAVALSGLYFMSLGAYAQIAGLIADLPSYVSRVNEIGQSVVERIEGVESTLNQLLPKRMQEKTVPPPAQPTPAPRRKRTPEPVATPTPPAVQEVRIQPEQSSVVTWLYNQIEQISEVLLAASFVPFLVYFMLSWRDHIRRSFLQLFEGENRGEISRSLSGVAELTRAYIAGNFMLGIVLSVITTGLFLFLRLPYALLVGPISGFLSLVPYVGLPMAVLPPALAALPTYSRLSQYLLLCTSVALLHLIAMNLMYPKIVGSRVHLNPLAVTTALMFWGLLWGGSGLALAIPITAGIKAVCDNVSGLEPYGRLLGD